MKCGYQGCVLLHCVSHVYVCVSPLDAGASDGMWGESLPAKLKKPGNHSTLGGKETQY